MSCPDLDSLLDPLGRDEAAQHIEECSDCRRLVTMAASVGGGFERGDACDDAELLIAVLAGGALEDGDDEFLAEHLATCRHCAAVGRSVLLDPPAPEIGAGAPVRLSHDALLRIAVPIAAIAAIAALLLVLTRGDGGDEATVAAPLAVEDLATPSADATPPPTTTRAPPPPDARPAPAARIRDAGAPRPRDAAALAAEEASQREARAAIQAIVKGGSLARAYAGCEKVRGSRWIKKCVVIACRARDAGSARRYLKRLPARVRPSFINLCLAQGVAIR